MGTYEVAYSFDCKSCRRLTISSEPLLCNNCCHPRKTFGQSLAATLPRGIHGTSKLFAAKAHLVTLSSTTQLFSWADVEHRYTPSTLDPFGMVTNPIPTTLTDIIQSRSREIIQIILSFNKQNCIADDLERKRDGLERILSP